MIKEKNFEKLLKYKNKHGIYPSVSVLPLIFDCTPEQTLQILNELCELQQIQLTDEGEIFNNESYVISRKDKHLPISKQSILAGFPEALYDDLNEVIDLQSYLVESPEQTIILPIKGNSMELAGITDGDLGIVKITTYANPGDIVAAEIDGNFTLKRLAVSESGDLFLKAENTSFEDMHPLDSLKIHGKLVGLVRRY